MFKDVFVQILQSKGISAYKLSQDTGITQGMISYWKNGERMPSADNLITLSKYLDVSVDYLLGNEQKNSVSTLSADTDSQEVYRQIKKLPPEKQKQVFDYVRFLAEQKNEK